MDHARPGQQRPTTGGQVDAEGLAVLAGKAIPVAERERATGVMTCPDCTKHREAAFSREKRYWSLSALVVRAIGQRAHTELPGTGLTWAEVYTRLTGIDWADAEQRERNRQAQRQRRSA